MSTVLSCVPLFHNSSIPISPHPHRLTGQVIATPSTCSSPMPGTGLSGGRRMVVLSSTALQRRGSRSSTTLSPSSTSHLSDSAMWMHRLMSAWWENCVFHIPLVQLLVGCFCLPLGALIPIREMSFPVLFHSVPCFSERKGIGISACFVYAYIHNIYIHVCPRMCIM